MDSTTFKIFQGEVTFYQISVLMDAVKERLQHIPTNPTRFTI